MPLSKEQFMELRSKGLSTEQIINFEQGNKPLEKKSFTLTPPPLSKIGAFMQSKTPDIFQPSLDMASSAIKSMAIPPAIGTASQRIVEKPFESLSSLSTIETGLGIGALAKGGAKAVSSAITRLRTPQYLKPEQLDTDTKLIHSVIQNFKKTKLASEYTPYETYGNVTVAGKKDLIDAASGVSQKAAKQLQTIIGKKNTATIDDLKKFMGFLDEGVKPDSAGKFVFSKREQMQLKDMIKNNYILPRIKSIDPVAEQAIRSADNFYREFAEPTYKSLAYTKDSATLRRILTSPNEATKRGYIYKVLKAYEDLPKETTKAISRVGKKGLLEKAGETFARGAEAGLGSRLARKTMGL